MKVISINNSALKDALREASMTLEAGGVVCFPTETFYGLGAGYDNRAACERLYSLKQRRHDKALPLIIGTTGVLETIASRLDDIEALLIRRFWPGPLTILLQARRDLPEFVTGGRPGRIAVRIPGRSFALDLALALGYPVTATSANISGMPAADSPEAVRRYFGDAPDLLIDGGKTPGGLSSTIVEVQGGRVVIVRQGAVSGEDIASALHAEGYGL